MTGLFWWVIFPYVCFTILILGVINRYAFRQITWAAPSTNFLEKRWLKWGSPMLHYGIICAAIGHVMGVLIPMDVYHALGINDHLYHFGAIYGGGLVGLIAVIGLVILLFRKITVEPVRIKATFADFFSVLMVLFVAGTGTYMTLVYNLTVMEYEYRETIGPWFRSLLILQPNYYLMSEVPFIFKLHVISSLAFFATIPFTRLIHMFSLPLSYIMRPPQQYRSRVGYRKHQRA